MLKGTKIFLNTYWGLLVITIALTKAVNFANIYIQLILIHGYHKYNFWDAPCNAYDDTDNFSKNMPSAYKQN